MYIYCELLIEAVNEKNEIQNCIGQYYIQENYLLFVSVSTQSILKV